jgi:hypothetical protein
VSAVGLLIIAISWVVGLEIGDRIHRALFKKCDCHFCMAWRFSKGLPMLPPE